MKKIWWHHTGGSDGQPVIVVDKHTRELLHAHSHMVFTDEHLLEMLHHAGKTLLHRSAEDPPQTT